MALADDVKTQVENIIDVGGGASTLADYLLKDGFKNITVLDLSSNALALARKRLGEKAGLINWKVEDVTCHIPEYNYQVIDGHPMDDSMEDACVIHFHGTRGSKRVLEAMRSKWKWQDFDEK